MKLLYISYTSEFLKWKGLLIVSIGKYVEQLDLSYSVGGTINKYKQLV